MDNWFKSKWFVRAISLAFAIVLYVFVQVETNQFQNDSRFSPNSNDDIKTIENVPVNIQIDDENYVVSGVPEFATVSLEGPTPTLKAVTQQRSFDVFVDLTKLEAGTHTVELEYSGVSEDLNVYTEPKTIEVTIEERASKEFDVAVDFINTDQLPEGYELGKPEVDPGAITITSSKEVIDQIAIVKIFVDVAGVKESIENREVPVNVYDSRGNELNVQVEPGSVSVSAELSNPSKDVPVTVSTAGELPEGYSLASISANVDKVEVFAVNDILQNLEEVTTKDIDLSKINQTGMIEVGLALPDGTNAPESKTIEVAVELEQTKRVEDVPISTGNLDDGQAASFIQPEDQSMNVTVTGNQRDVSELSSEDIQVIADAEGLGGGERQIPISIETPDNIEVNSSEFEQVTVEITS